MPDQAGKSSEATAGPSDDPSKRSLFFEPQDVATSKAEGKVFKVHRAILVKDSVYFEKALNGPFLEGQTQTIDFEDDVKAVELAFYVDILYRSYFVEDFELRTRHLYTNTNLTSTVLRLLMLSNRLLNRRLRDIATAWLDSGLASYTPSSWERFFERSTLSRMAGRIRALQKAFDDCRKYDLPYEDEIVQVAANMPPQLFHELHDMLQLEFRSAITKKFMRRFENPKLKRHCEKGGNDEGNSPAKRQKQE